LVNNDIKVSVITVCYNSVATIEDTILSVIKQSYPNIEYIIIDGGSNDGTQDIIKKYEHHINYWISETDKGIADAWNKGIRKASGEIIGIINADDFYEKDAVNVAVQKLTASPDYGFVFGNLEVIGKDGRKKYLLQGSQNYERQINYDMPQIPHPTVFVKKYIYAQCGLFDVAYKTALDYEFLLRLHKNGVKGVYIDYTFATMRLGGESDTNYKRAHNEVAQASIIHGYVALFAYCRLYYKLSKSYVRHTLDKMGLNFLSRFFRKIFHSQYKYEE
jgi:glycosyltransferase involved in cell wall biosynthesis